MRLFEIFWKSLLLPKCQFSQPFSILQLVKSLPFYIPPAWKRYTFRAEPPLIVHYREYPPPPGTKTALINPWKGRLKSTPSLLYGSPARGVTSPRPHPSLSTSCLIHNPGLIRWSLSYCSRFLVWSRISLLSFCVCARVYAPGLR